MAAELMAVNPPPHKEKPAKPTLMYGNVCQITTRLPIVNKFQLGLGQQVAWAMGQYPLNTSQRH